MLPVLLRLVLVVVLILRMLVILLMLFILRFMVLLLHGRPTMGIVLRLTMLVLA
jgi:hypothetical protein